MIIFIKIKYFCLVVSFFFLTFKQRRCFSMTSSFHIVIVGSNGFLRVPERVFFVIFVFFVSKLLRSGIAGRFGCAISFTPALLRAVRTLQRRHRHPSARPNSRCKFRSQYSIHKVSVKLRVKHTTSGFCTRHSNRVNSRCGVGLTQSKVRY